MKSESPGIRTLPAGVRLLFLFFRLLTIIVCVYFAPGTRLKRHASRFYTTYSVVLTPDLRFISVVPLSEAREIGENFGLLKETLRSSLGAVLDKNPDGVLKKLQSKEGREVRFEYQPRLTLDGFDFTRLSSNLRVEISFPLPT